MHIIWKAAEALCSQTSFKEMFGGKYHSAGLHLPLFIILHPFVTITYVLIPISSMMDSKEEIMLTVLPCLQQLR